MIDVEPFIARELGRLVPAPAAVRADWNDVVARAGLRWSRRRLVVGFAALAAILVTATAVARSTGGFGGWLSGTPGKPAPREAQSRFAAANGRSWASFPRGTKLRELVRAKVAGVDYVLYGFRSGNSLCLQLASSAAALQPKACAPAALVFRVSAPVVVVIGDFAFYDRAARPVARASFGIVADGIERVDVDSTDGIHRAPIGGNAYLFVQAEPNSPSPIQSVAAVDAAGRHTRVALAALRDPGARRSAAPGPSKVEARIRNPRIGWYERGERRGVSVDDVKLTPRERGVLRGARLVKPDPLSDFVVGLSGRYCLVTRISTGCGPRPFEHGPLNLAANAWFSSEFLTIYGMAADGVRRVTIFLGDGQRIRAPLRDNLFAAIVPPRLFPIRVVGYDTRSRVVAIDTGINFARGFAAPAAARRFARTRSVTGPNGSTATLDLGKPAGDFQCWRLRAGAITRNGCMTLMRTGPKIEAHLVQPIGRDVFLFGWSSAKVAHVDLELPLHRRIASARPLPGGSYLVAVPRAGLSGERQHAYLVGFDRAGHRVQRIGVFYRSP